MRLNINLASQPYEDARRFWLRWGGVLAVAAILTLVLVYSTLAGWLSARKDRETIRQYREQIARLDGERSKAEELLNRPENRDTRDKSQFLNDLFRRKALSWTEVLEDLEGVMPPRLHVVSIHPETTPDHQLQLRLIVGGESRDRALELVRRMEQNPRFREPRVIAEQAQTGQASGDNVEFEISTLYAPAAKRSAP